MEGILLVDKPEKISSFHVVSILRKRAGVKKIGHGGTLDPFATGLLVLFISRNYTKRAQEFLDGDKEYRTTLRLGIATNSFDTEGEVTNTSDVIPTLDEVKRVLDQFQGTLLQVPPMFSAKKIGGKRLYEMARKGVVVERAPVQVHVTSTLVSYSYPELTLHVHCSKGTYIRSLGHDIGVALGTFAHLTQLRRVRSGRFSVDTALSLQKIKDPSFPLASHVIT